MIRVKAPAPRKAAKSTPPPAPEPMPVAPGKASASMGQLLKLLRRPEGVSCDEAAAILPWKPHTVRARITSDLAKKMKLPVQKEITKERGRVYRLPA